MQNWSLHVARVKEGEEEAGPDDAAEFHLAQLKFYNDTAATLDHLQGEVAPLAAETAAQLRLLAQHREDHKGDASTQAAWSAMLAEYRADSPEPREPSGHASAPASV